VGRSRAYPRKGSSAGTSNPQRVTDRRALDGMPRRALPSSARRARGRVLHPGRVERRAPAALVVAGQLEIVALAGHADRDPADAGPGVEPGAQDVKGMVIRRKPDEAKGRSQELAALVDHALLDHLIRPLQ
jgi:hypothetical protein